MKRVMIFCIVFLMALSLASAIEINLNPGGGTPIDSAQVQVVNIKYKPYPVEPGETFDFWVKIQNTGQSAAPDAACKLVLDYPFSLYQGEMLQEFGALNPGSSGLLKFVLKTDNNAAEGDNDINIECTSNPESGSWIRANANITIQTRYPTLNIAKVETEPSAIAPGHKADLILTVENLAQSSMRDITVKIDFSSVPFAPYSETGEKKISRINAGDSQAITFGIVALASAEGGIYKVPVSITYTDNLGNLNNISSIISIEINSMPDLVFSAESSELTTSSRTGLIDLKIINKGLTNIKFMTARMLPYSEVKLLSSDTAYIGDVDSDDSESAEFRITAKSDKLVIPFELNYRDVSNNPFTEQVNVTYNLPSASEAGKGGVNWIVVIIVLIAVIFVYIKRKAIIGWIKSKF